VNVDVETVMVPMEGLEAPDAEAKASTVEEKPKAVAPDVPGLTEQTKQKRKGGRKPVKVQLTPERIARGLEGLHRVADLFLPGAAITRQEADLMGEAIYEVIQEYDLSWLLKYLPVINLAITVAMVEYPVFLRVKANREAAKKQAQAPSVVQAGPKGVVVLEEKPRRRGGRRKKQPEEAVVP